MISSFSTSTICVNLHLGQKRGKFLNTVIVHEKRKENGHYRQEVEIVYNFIGAVEIPDFLEDDEYDGLNC